jgi:putative transposase
MYFEKDGIYHIFNQGNKKQPIFFNRENYLFFLRKIKTQVLPYADVLAWCLMPNHFHLMVYVRETEVRKGGNSSSLNEPILNQVGKSLSLNQSIGIMLASYTRAINKQENCSGSLFRQETKANCLNEIKGLSPNWITSSRITYINLDIPEKNYLQACFQYINRNPESAGLVSSPEEWEFSSFRDLAGIRDGKLINREKIRDLGLSICSGSDFDSQPDFNLVRVRL